mgnify:CR=1 FL=1
MDGGFSTYKNRMKLLSSLNSEKIVNIDGWVQSHFCVSSFAYFLMTEIGKFDKLVMTNLEQFLLNHLKQEGLKSYWWTKDYYALYYILKGSINIRNKTISNLVEVIIEKELNKKSKINNYFSGYIIRIICSSDKLFKKYSDLVIKSVNNLVRHQFSDGSWDHGFSLKIPHPNVLNPNLSRLNYIKASSGTNILVNDFSRIFSSTSVLSALLDYERRLS